MPGRNPAGTHTTDDYNLGRGKAYFASLDSAGLPEAYRDLGNVVELNISVEKEELDHQSSREGLKVIDKTVVLSQKVTISSLVMDELNFENIAFFFSGASGQESNEAQTGVPTPSGNLTVTTQGRWYDLYEDASGQPSSDPQGKRIYDIGNVSIQSAEGSAMVATTDYTVDSVMGRIFVVDGGSMDAGDYDVTISPNASGAANVDVMRALTSSATEGALKFISENPASDDHQYEWQFHKVKLSAEGDVPLIGDEWTTLTVSGTAEQNSAADPDSPTLTVTTHENAVDS